MKADEWIDEAAKELTEVPEPLKSSICYALTTGGKRLRPILSMLGARISGANEDEVKNFAVAVELIHTYSLVHDDLPSMDNDELRRGKPTVHVKFGESIAVLTGDALLNLAYETASQAFDLEPGNPTVGKAFQILSAKTGMTGMIGGQSVDVEYVDRPLSAEQLQFIYELKTGALIEASMMIGAVLAGADADTVEKVGQIGQNVGMAFQIQDDILDVTGDEAVLGKPTKSDEKNHKITYVSVKGLDQARKDVERYSKEAVRLLEELPCENEFLHELILNLISRDA